MRYSTSEFETLYARCFPPSMKLAMSLLHDEDEARDAVQEVFVKFWEDNIQIENPLTYFIRAVRNKCLNRINMLDTHEKILKRIMLESPPDDFDIDARSREVRSAIAMILTPREQEVVEKIYTDGMSYKEAAAILEVSTAAINKNLVSALKKLRTHFKTVQS